VQTQVKSEKLAQPALAAAVVTQVRIQVSRPAGREDWEGGADEVEVPLLEDWACATRAQERTARNAFVLKNIANGWRAESGVFTPLERVFEEM